MKTFIGFLLICIGGTISTVTALDPQGAMAGDTFWYLMGCSLGGAGGAIFVRGIQGR